MKDSLVFLKVTLLASVLFSLLGFAIEKDQSDYSYKLSIISNSREVEFFDLEITSEIDTIEVKVIVEFKGLTTPFEKVLPSGIHEISIRTIGERGSISSKVHGVFNGRERGSAAGSSKNTILKAGPNGTFESISEHD